VIPCLNRVGTMAAKLSKKFDGLSLDVEIDFTQKFRKVLNHDLPRSKSFAQLTFITISKNI